MTRAEFDAAVLEGRAQDPRIGALKLKHIVRTLFVPAPPPVPEARVVRRKAPPAAEA